MVLLKKSKWILINQIKENGIWIVSLNHYFSFVHFWPNLCTLCCSSTISQCKFISADLFVDSEGWFWPILQQYENVFSVFSEVSVAEIKPQLRYSIHWYHITIPWISGERQHQVKALASIPCEWTFSITVTIGHWIRWTTGPIQQNYLYVFVLDILQNNYSEYFLI